MNYIGSKAKLIPFLKTTIQEIVGHSLHDKVFCDLFAGSGVVGNAFKNDFRAIISNDMEFYSYVLLKHNFHHILRDNSSSLIESLHEIEPKEGFIYQHYCEGSGSGRCYFSDENGQKIDAIREKVEMYKEDTSLYYFLLASLLQSADKVANTASIYSAFLKKLKPLAIKPLLLEAILCESDAKSHEVYCEDANALITKIKGDVLYLDPPYNHRQYGANYHILNTIALQEEFIPKGKTGVRNYVSSSYCKKSTALKTFEGLIASANFPYIFMSYNDEGLMHHDEIAEVMRKYGTYTCKVFPHQRFKAYDNKACKKATLEYIHILEKE